MVHRGGADAPPASVLLKKDLKHSHIALMPEWRPDDIGAFRPLRPSVVAWGTDPVHSLGNPRALRKLTDEYRELGIKLQACNVWMLTATSRVLHDNPEYQDAVCLDIAGERIVPGWLDKTYKGVKQYWGCTSHPLFRKQLAERVRAGIESGANMLHLDDHLGTCAAANHSGGCFCRYCMRGFRAWLTDNLNRKQLAENGVTNVATFDYGKRVRKAGFTTREAYKKGTWQNRIPLRKEYLAFQREAAAGLVKELGTVARRTAGKPVPVGVNSYNLSPTQLATSHNADFFANEVQHYGVEETIPPLVYMLGSALGKPVFSTGSGHCWIKVSQHNDVTRVRRWIATAHAFGHYSMYAYKKWSFSKETGTKWYMTPIETYEPLCRFITDNAALFDDYEPVAQVGVLYDNGTCEKNRWGVREVCRHLHDANIPCGLAVAGDGWLKRELTRAELDRFQLVVIPGDAAPEGHQAAVIEDAKKRGKAIAWTNVEDIRKRVEPLVLVSGAEPVWALPRQKPDQPGTPTVIHLLNQDYNAGHDVVCRKSGFTVFLADKITGGRPATKVTLCTIGQEPRSLPVARVEGGITVTIPELDLWAVLQVR
jgi:hypothetical protein